MALRTQQIIASETGVANTVDPVGGSYAIEAATNRIEQDAVAMLERIDAAGGTLPAIEPGLIQREIQESAYRAQQRIDAGDADRRRREPVSGVDGGRRSRCCAIDPELEQQQRARVAAVRASRDAGPLALGARRGGDRGASRQQPRAADHRRRRGQATVGEIADALRRVFGEHEEIDV